MPVVSQSIISPMVPVGASTEACELRTPTWAASSQALSHASWAADSSDSWTWVSSISAAAARCCSSTRSVGSAFSA